MYIMYGYIHTLKDDIGINVNTQRYIHHAGLSVFMMKCVRCKERKGQRVKKETLTYLRTY